MKAAGLIRIAAGLVFLHAVLHTAGGVLGKVPDGPAATAALAMQTNWFSAFGVQRTFWQFYLGLGLAVTIFLLMESVVLWLLAPLADNGSKQVRAVLAVFAIGYVVFAVDSYRYFFFAPVVVELLIALCLATAIARARWNDGRA